MSEPTDEQINKLVEKKARILYNYLGNVNLSWEDCFVRGKYRYIIRDLISDLALIDRNEHIVACPFCDCTGDDRNDSSKECPGCHGKGTTIQKIVDVIPIADALKELPNDKTG